MYSSQVMPLASHVFTGTQAWLVPWHCYSISDYGENLLFILPQLSWKQAQALAPNQHLIRTGQKVVNALWLTTKTAQEGPEEDGKELKVSKEAPLWIRLCSVPTRHGQRTSRGVLWCLASRGVGGESYGLGDGCLHVSDLVRHVTPSSLWGSCSGSGAVFWCVRVHCAAGGPLPLGRAVAMDMVFLVCDMFGSVVCVRETKQTVWLPESTRNDTPSSSARTEQQFLYNKTM